ncbi:arginine-glutamic acid dipeptide repeats protein-like isoform X1 [Branchiostoma lanceolatum]|uniref:arginine-glutamic acid dipeptide repeats protein-like isoform X1 n=1 Tax=Branchiostoma lanceolatum TaxID=7740 RepID=UPI0034563F6D
MGEEGNKQEMEPRETTRRKRYSIEETREEKPKRRLRNQPEITSWTVGGVSYKVGDCVYIDSQRADNPYYICSIQEFRMTKKETVYLEVKWFYRTSEVPDSVYHLLVQDRNSENSEDSVIKESLMKSRELFISDATDSYPVSALRGRCCVHHYPDIIAAKAFDANPNTFFYILGYNPETRRLNGTQGEIRVGPSHQAKLPEYNPNRQDDGELQEELVWTPKVNDCDLLMYLRAARSMAAFAGMCDGGSPDDGCLAASRDETTINALDTLHQFDYNTGKALQALVKRPVPVSADRKWTDDETKRFVKGLRQFGKNFFRIHKELLPEKETSELVEFYYLWKKTPAANNCRPHRRHRRQSTLRRVRGVGSRAGNGNRPPSSEFLDLSSASETELENVDSEDSDSRDLSAYACRHCFTTTSRDWHHGGHDKVILCTDCRIFFKKYGELRPIETPREPPPFMFKPVKEDKDDDAMNSGKAGMRTRRNRDGVQSRHKGKASSSSPSESSSPVNHLANTRHLGQKGRQSPSTGSTTSNSSDKSVKKRKLGKGIKDEDKGSKKRHRDKSLSEESEATNLEEGRHKKSKQTSSRSESPSEAATSDSGSINEESCSGIQEYTNEDENSSPSSPENDNDSDYEPPASTAHEDSQPPSPVPIKPIPQVPRLPTPPPMQELPATQQPVPPVPAAAPAVPPVPLPPHPLPPPPMQEPDVPPPVPRLLPPPPPLQPAVPLIIPKQEPKSPSPPPREPTPPRDPTPPASPGSPPSSPEVPRSPRSPSPPAVVVDRQDHVSASARFIRHLSRRDNTCSRTDLTFVPLENTKLAKKRAEATKKAEQAKHDEERKKQVDERETREREREQEHDREREEKQRRPPTTPPPRCSTADVQITGPHVHHQGHHGSAFPQSLSFQQGPFIGPDTPALRTLSEYARPHAMASQDPNMPYHLPPGFFIPGAPEHEIRERELREREMREREIRERELRESGFKPGYELKAMEHEQIRMSQMEMHRLWQGHPMAPGHQPGTAPPFASPFGPYAHPGASVLDRERMAHPMHHMQESPHVNPVERLNAERLQAERNMALAMDPIVRLQLAGITPHHHQHSHSHTHLHLHPQDPLYGVPPHLIGPHPWPAGMPPPPSAGTPFQPPSPFLRGPTPFLTREHEIHRETVLSRQYEGMIPPYMSASQQLSAQAQAEQLRLIEQQRYMQQHHEDYLRRLQGEGDKPPGPP